MLCYLIGVDGRSRIPRRLLGVHIFALTFYSAQKKDKHAGGNNGHTETGKKKAETERCRDFIYLYIQHLQYISIT